jgi:hypothetical protein
MEGVLKKNLLIVVALFLGAFLLFKVNSNAIAQTDSGGSGFRVSPVRAELVLEKGSTSKEKITVVNLSGEKTTAKIIINDFEPASDETGQPKILLDENSKTKNNSFKDIATTEKEITLNPRESKEIYLYIKVPENANAGGYYGVLRFAGTTEKENKNIALAASVGTLFLVTVPGDLKENVSLVDFSAASKGSTGRFFINASELSIITRLENVGNIHVKPFGLVEIKDSSNKVVESFDLNSTDPRSNILPGSTRKFEDNLKN